MTATRDRDEEEGRLRRESLGAFSHDLGTPLTSIGMVLELAERDAAGGALTFDPELVRMLKASISNLETLAESLQEVTRFERGRLALSRGPSDLGAAIRAAADLVAPGITFAREQASLLTIVGPWDGPRLSRAFAAFAVAADRAAAGAGEVTLHHELQSASVCVVLQGGERDDSQREVMSDLGFAFFHARALIAAMGGSVECERGEGYLRVRFCLPLA